MFVLSKFTYAFYFGCNLKPYNLSYNLYTVFGPSWENRFFFQSEGYVQIDGTGV